MAAIFSDQDISRLIQERKPLSDDYRTKIQTRPKLGLAKQFIKLEDVDFDRAKVLRGIGFSDMDALHIACAEKGGIDFFITCDDSIVNLLKPHLKTPSCGRG